MFALPVGPVPFFVFFPFFVGEGNKKNARAHNFCSKMCSLARSYYRGNRTQKSTAITAKLFVFLIDIFIIIIYFNKSFLLSILLAFFYSIFNWGILGTIGTSISAAKIAFLNSFPVICVMNWTSGLMMDNLQKDNLLPEAYAIVPTTFHTIFIMAITVVLSLWLIIRFYKKWTR